MKQWFAPLLCALVVLGALAGAGSADSIGRSGYARSVLADRPFAYWRFDDRPGSRMLRDASGHGAALWVKQGATLWVAGALWKAADPAVQGSGVLAYGLAAKAPTVVEFWIAV